MRILQGQKTNPFWIRLFCAVKSEENSWICRVRGTNILGKTFGMRKALYL